GPTADLERNSDCARSCTMKTKKHPQQKSTALENTGLNTTAQKVAQHCATSCSIHLLYFFSE
ncbi:hypothetical protein KUU44_39725, partial [Pseudomonas aeruginosa]|nr:hypothetical protein [Pseudomonas aeruginosa]